MKKQSNLDPYVSKNKGYVTSHMIKLFREDEWTYKLKYVDCLVPPYRERNPKSLEMNDALLIGQAVDDWLTHGEDYFRENYAVVKQRVNNLSETLDNAHKKAASFKDPTCKGALEAKQKIEYYSNIAGKIQLTEANKWAIDECIYEARAQTLFLEKYEKDAIIVQLDGFPFGLRGELDHLSPDRKTVVDLKTTANLDSFDPSWYSLQMAYYQFLVEEHYGVRPTVYLHVLEKPAPRKPYSRSQVYQYSDKTLLAERKNIIETLAKMKQSHESGVFMKPSQAQRLRSEFYGYEGYGRPTDIILY